MTTFKHQKTTAIRRLLPLLSLLLCLLPGLLPLSAQGWEKYFGGPNEDLGHAVIQTSDLGYLLVGYSESFGTPMNQDLNIYVVKTDVDGTTIWQRTYDPGITEFGRAALQTPDEGFLIAGEASFLAVNGPFQGFLLKIGPDGKEEAFTTYSEPGVRSIRINDLIEAETGYLLIGYAEYEDKDDDILLIKVDENGQEEWKKIMDSGRGERANAAALVEGGYIITGREDSPFPPPITFGGDIVVYRVDSEGETVWKQVVATLEDSAGNDVVVDQAGNIVVAGFIGNNRDVGLWKYDQQGAKLDSVVVDFFGQSDEANAIIIGHDGSYIIGGSTEVDGANVDKLIASFSTDLNLQWANNTGDRINTDEALGIAPASNGGYVLIGSTGSLLNFVNRMVLTLTDAQGQIHSNRIRGRVFHDLDEACDFDVSEPRLEGWIVRATGENGTFFGFSDEDGRFNILVDTGAYVVEALVKNPYWSSCLPNGVNIVFDELYDDININFPMKAEVIDCPLMQVDVSTPFLANCTDIQYTIAYENIGTGPSNGDTKVELTLDPALTFESASLPFTLENDVYTFELGSVPYNEGGSFVVNTQMACSGIVQGQAAYVVAHIFPDTLCLAPDPDWTGASVTVDGQCDGDGETVEFRISNMGAAAMDMERTFFVVEEDLMFLTQPFNLDVDEETPIELPATGATYRIIAEQVEGHPGNSFPTKAVEGCGTDTEGSYSTGFVTQWPEDDASAAISVHVDEVLGTPEAVYMGAHPKGWQDSLITAETELTYRVFFRNIGTDSLTRVVVRDTLPEELDISTITFGASSHPIETEVYHTGVVKVTFNNLELPVNSDGSSTLDYAYYEYRIKQKPGNPQGTVIENDAFIIFDYYPPQRTNTTRHVIDAPTYSDLLETIPVPVKAPEWASQAEVLAYPNPATDHITLEVKGLQGQHELDFLLLNMNGQRLRHIRNHDHQCTFDRKGMPAGNYIYLVRSEGQQVAAGTLIIR